MSPRPPSPQDAMLPVERIVLLGFMCSGKSTVGESLARRLEWQLLDFDREIEHREGRSVPAIINERGEEYFRSLEAELTREAAGVTRLVLAPGGGWITRPELLDHLGAGTLAVWIRVSPEETVRRMLYDENGTRPLTDHPEPIVPVTAMLAEREPLYRLADVITPGDGRGAEEVAFEIEQLARTRGLVRGRPADEYPQ